MVTEFDERKPVLNDNLFKDSETNIFEITDTEMAEIEKRCKQWRDNIPQGVIGAW